MGRARIVGLSDRELAVLSCAAEGLGRAETADALFISLGTTATHLGRAYEKLGARNKTHAVALALRAGLLKAGAE